MPTIGYKPNSRLSSDEIEVRVWAFVIVVLVTILLVSMGMFLYSVSFVTQPMNGSMAAIDKVYTQQCCWSFRGQGNCQRKRQGRGH